ncbi:S-layer homology domain-containing protein [Metalysinibacillus jejuensis]|uniref:S-layer homology domain-containing protein n=1 Tax=Metalysinibacillus jejuensis TaxID=914327 RepID=UPI000D374664|nr:S-layer homology domain-containing protein [Metalysinibacillus jejuensis]
MKKITISVLALLLAVIFTVTPASASNFKDVSSKHTLKIEIDYLVETGVIGGYPDGTFKPNQLIQKKHIAKMMAAALQLPKDQLKHPNYKDVSRSHPYYEDIAALYTAGIFSDAPYFKPDSYISRAFMAKILAEAFDLKSISQNSVTYRDVSQNHAFYRPIQLVAMNNVAKSVRANDGSLYFQPNKMLTRAHFSAFLARAMTLNKGDYLPNPNYDYYYTDNTALLFKEYQNLDFGKATGWNFFNPQTGRYGLVSYGLIGGSWRFSIPQTDASTSIAYPFTIGLNPDYLNKLGMLGIAASSLEKQEIINTNETLTIEGHTFTNVVAIKTTYPKYMENNKGEYYEDKVEFILYLAPDYGPIANYSNGKYEYKISHRIAR